MATRYFPLSSKQAAQAQSEEWWVKVLGRAKLPLDITSALFPTITHPNDAAQNYLVVDDAGFAMLAPTLTPAQLAFAEANLLPASDPGVVATLQAIKAQFNI